VSGGHVGRAAQAGPRSRRRAATATSSSASHPPARHRRTRSRSRAISCGRAGGGDRAVRDRATPPSARSLAVAMGAGGVGKGVAAAAARRERPPSASWRSCSAPATPAHSATRSTAPLVDLAGFYREHAHRRRRRAGAAHQPRSGCGRSGRGRHGGPSRCCRRLEAFLACRHRDGSRTSSRRSRSRR
jgi:DNA polymerase-3 subunit delta'